MVVIILFILTWYMISYTIPKDIMPTAILIGFEYTFNSLTGALIDLYRAYKWCTTFGCDITVITDIERVNDISKLDQAVKLKITGEDLLNFYDSIPLKFIIKSGSVFMETIMSTLSSGIPDNKMVIYYSGHGVRDSLVMPDRTLVPFVDFRNNILDSLDPYVELFWILDCCNPNGLHLPYKLDGNAFVLSSSKIECVSQPILLISSSEANERSIATKHGSVFSQHLFRLLTRLNTDVKIINKKSITIPLNKNRNLRRLIGDLTSPIRKMHTGYAQTVSIYSSYVIDPILWMWIGTQKSYDIVADISLSTLIIRNHRFVPTKHNMKKKSNPYDRVYPD